jgi:hypothetical protein
VPKEKPLKPEGFPVHTNQKEIVTDTGKPIAGTRDKETAEDIADRLNSDHVQEDRIAGLSGGTYQPASDFDLAGCALLTGSDAGKVPSSSLSSLSFTSLSAFSTCFGSEAWRSIGAGLNFSAMISSIVKLLPNVSGTHGRRG